MVKSHWHSLLFYFSHAICGHFPTDSKICWGWRMRVCGSQWEWNNKKGMRKERALTQKPKSPRLESQRASDSVRSNFRNWAGIVRASRAQKFIRQLSWKNCSLRQGTILFNYDFWSWSFLTLSDLNRHGRLWQTFWNVRAQNTSEVVIEHCLTENTHSFRVSLTWTYPGWTVPTEGHCP